MHPHKTNRYLLLFAMLVIACTYLQAQEVKLMLPIGHTGSINTAVFSPDGKKIVTASGDKTVKIWDAVSGQLLNTLEGHRTDVRCATFSPDGNKLVTTSLDYIAKVWDAKTGKLLHILEGHTLALKSAFFSPDGNTILTASGDSTAKLWDALSGELLHSFTGHTNEVNSAVFSPDGKKIVTASDDNSAVIWDASTRILLVTLRGKTSINSATFSPDGKKILTAYYNSFFYYKKAKDYTTAKIWDAITGEMLVDLQGYTDNVGVTSFSPDGERIVTASNDNTAKIWDTQTGTLLADLKGHTSKVHSIYFSPDGERILTSSNDKAAKIWDAVSGQLLHSLEGHTEYVHSATFSPNGKKIVTTSGNTAKIWDAETGILSADLKGGISGVSNASISPDGKKIVTATYNGLVKTWDASSGIFLKDWVGHNSSIVQACFSPDGKKIITASLDKTAKIWDAVEGLLLTHLKGNTAYIVKASFSLDGKKIVTASLDKTAKIWDAVSGSLVNNLEGHTEWVKSATFSPEGEKIITASYDKSIKIWETSTGKLLSDFKVYNFINDASFSPESKTIITANAGGTAKLWDAVSGQLVLSLDGHARGFQLYKATFSPNGKTIITASEDGTAKLWDAATGSLELTIILGVNTFISNINFTINRFTAINNGEVKLFNLTTGEHLLSYFAIDSTDWAVLHPSGLFDASPGAMDKMYWVKGDEVIDFGQLKERYWQPGLWKMIMDGQPLRSVAGMNTLQLQPEIELGELKNNILTIQLKKRDGGYGKVAILVNNKEVITDARPKGFDTTKMQQTIVVNLAPYLAAGLDNTISVKTQTANGFVSSRGISVTQKATTQTTAKKPAFYAIICGTGAFSNPAIKLKYAVPDAAAIAKAVTIGANNLFGKDSTHVYLLASPGNTPTTKQNIQQAFASIKAKAKAEDIVMVYLSGHGISYGGDNGDFYYLTTEASGTSTESFADPALRQAQAINTAEFTQWLNAIPALKQVMIIDACGSGKAVDNLIAKRDIDASQIKAIDRMKDRTGLYIISGCAADAVSYEASRYGQGLLTYAVLQAMKGAALKENTNVDILTLLNYARDEVPKMATGIGGIQQPQLLVPKGGSFDIGIIKETDKVQIPLAQIKPVFLRATLFEETKKRDVLKLSQAINEKLNDVSARGDAKSNIVFIDADEYPDACSISGGYIVVDNLISFNGTLLCGTTEKVIKIEKVSKEQLVEKLVEVAIKN